MNILMDFLGPRSVDDNIFTRLDNIIITVLFTDLFVQNNLLFVHVRAVDVDVCLGSGSGSSSF